MKLSDIFMPLALVIAAGIIAGVAYNYLSGLQQLQEKRARDMAVEGCMQVANYSWQAQNQNNAELLDTTQEPNRYWYRLCMQEKGYDIVSDI